MAGYLDNYGVTDQKRERRNRLLIISGLAALILGTVGFFYFRTWSEERALSHFLAELQAKNYQNAYKLWTQETAKYYGPEKFLQDWGADGVYKNPGQLKIQDIDSCGEGVVFHMLYPGSEDFGLWVEKKDNSISFAGWARCPGKHLQIWEFVKSRFSGGSK